MMDAKFSPPRRVSRAFFNIGWRYLLRRPWQSLLMILGITLGVAVVVAIDLANSSASRAFMLSTDTIAGKTTHQITGGPTGLDEQLYTQIKRRGVPVTMAPVVASYTTSPELGDVPMQLLGVDPFSEAPFRNYLGNEDDELTPITALANFFTQPGAVLISSGLAEQYNLTACDTPPDLNSVGNGSVITAAGEDNCIIRLEFDGQLRPAYIAGLLNPSDGLSRRALNGLILADIATAQELSGGEGRLSQIDLILPEAAAQSQIAQLNTFLPAGVQLQPVAARTGTVAEMTSAFQLNLTALSLLALVVGLFLIYNTMTFAVVQRRPVFGTLRCLGVTRREVFALVVSEALLVGVIGSLLGIGLGIALGQAAIGAVTQTINDLFFVLTVREVEIPAISLVKGLVLGVGATTLTAAFPAWEAASTPPRLALSRSGLEFKARKAVYLAAGMGVVLIALGGVLLWLPGSDLVVSFTGTFAVIIGFAMLTPITTAALMWLAVPVLGRARGLLGRMAPRDVVNTLSRTSIAVAALMVAVSVTIGVNLMVSSFRYTVEVWLAQTLQGDVYISPPSTSAIRSTDQIIPEVLDLLKADARLGRVDVLRSTIVDSDQGPLSIAATDNFNAPTERLFLSQDYPAEQMWDAMLEGGVIVSEPLANRLELPRNNGSLRLLTDTGFQEFPVIGIYYDYASVQGVAIMPLSVYQSRWDDQEINAVAIRLEPEGDADAITRALQAELTPLQRLDIRPNAALRAEALDVFDRTFAITTALQLLATIVAFIGVLSALLSLQLEKGRELGILRAVGMTARQMRELILMETGLMGAAAGLLALPTGFLLALILIYIINQRAFGWTLQLQLSGAPFIQAMLVAVGAALLAGVYPAIKMSRMVTAEALRRE